MPRHAGPDGFGDRIEQLRPMLGSRGKWTGLPQFARDLDVSRERYRSWAKNNSWPGREILEDRFARLESVKQRGLSPGALAMWLELGAGDPPVFSTVAAADPLLAGGVAHAERHGLPPPIAPAGMKSLGALLAQPETRDPSVVPALAQPPTIDPEKALARALEAHEKGDAENVGRILRFAVKAIRGAREALSEAKELGLATVIVLAGGAAVEAQPPLRDFDSKKISFTSGGRRRARVTGGRVVMFPAAHVPSGFHAASSRLMIAPRQPARSLVRAGT